MKQATKQKQASILPKDLKKRLLAVGYEESRFRDWRKQVMYGEIRIYGDLQDNVIAARLSDSDTLQFLNITVAEAVMVEGVYSFGGILVRMSDTEIEVEWFNLLRRYDIDTDAAVSFYSALKGNSSRLKLSQKNILMPFLNKELRTATNRTIEEINATSNIYRHNFKVKALRRLIQKLKTC